MGRPLKDIDGEQVYKLAKLGCTQEEIGEFFGCARSVITERFSTEYTRARAGWKQSIRRAQTIRAIKDRSDTMLLHLGKCYLGQESTTEPITKAEVIAKAQARANDRKRDRKPDGPSS